jgi:hypothetical protein
LPTKSYVVSPWYSRCQRLGLAVSTVAAVMIPLPLPRRRARWPR